MRLGLDRLVEGDGLEDVEELALVFVDALDLHVEQGGRIDADLEPLGDQPRQGFLVGSRWTAAKRSWKAASSASGSSPRSASGSSRTSGPDRLDEEVASGAGWPDAASAGR